LIFLLGRIHGNKGRNWTQEAKKKFSDKRKNEGNPRWTGHAVGYYGVHNWLRKYNPKPEYCEFCHVRPPVHLANISGQYVRDISHYKWLCISCHRRTDKARARRIVLQ